MFNSFDVQHIIQIYIIYHVFFHWINAYKSLIIIIWRTTERPFRGNVNQKNSRNVFDRLWYPLSILLLAAIGAKLIGPHDGLQVDKNDVTGSTEWPCSCYYCVIFCDIRKSYSNGAFFSSEEVLNLSHILHIWSNLGPFMTSCHYVTIWLNLGPDWHPCVRSILSLFISISGLLLANQRLIVGRNLWNCRFCRSQGCLSNLQTNVETETWFLY